LRPDDRDPLHHKVLAVQALLSPSALLADTGKWHGCTERSAHPAAHFASNAQTSFSIAWFEPSAGLWIEGASSSPRFADAVRLNAPMPFVSMQSAD
jgi:hypothetical protein